jgi:hypothetical protein
MQPQGRTSLFEIPTRLFPLLAVLAAGFAVRLYACLNTAIINPDGPLYIYQAKAIYLGQWDRLTSCGLSYVSTYPFFIAGTHAIFNDWMSSAVAVSIFFGAFTIVPVYLLLRRFLDRPVSLLSILAFALIPTLVDSSVEVIKDPVSWPFAAFGLLFFVKHLEGRNGMYLLLSSSCFLAAALARIEVILFLFVSCLFLVSTGRNRVFNLLGFLAPVALFALAAALIFNGTGNHSDHLRLAEALKKLWGGPDGYGYESLRLSLDALIQKPVVSTTGLFLKKARHLIWLIALASLLNSVMKAFFYPFFALLLVGLKGIGGKIKSDPRIAFLSSVSLAVLFLLYVHTLQTWVIETRFLVLSMLPGFIWVGFGIEKLLVLLTARFHMSTRSALALTFAMIVAFGLPKNLNQRGSDKISIRHIAEQIRNLEQTSNAVPVAVSPQLLHQIFFYTNLHVEGNYCPQPYSDFSTLVGRSYDEFLRNLRNGQMKYFVWEEKQWPTGVFDFNKTAKPEHFKAIRSWSHPDSGGIVLYRILP